VAALAGEPLIMPEHSPEVLLVDFADSWMTYRIRVWTTDFAADERVRDRVRSRVYYAFSRHGIAFPYPVQLRGDPAAPAAAAAAAASAEARLAAGRAETRDAVEILASLSADQRTQRAARAALLLYGGGEVIA